jgi:hypothetical protein
MPGSQTVDNIKICKFSVKLNCMTAGSGVSKLSWPAPCGWIFFGSWRRGLEILCLYLTEFSVSYGARFLVWGESFELPVYQQQPCHRQATRRPKSEVIE